MRECNICCCERTDNEGVEGFFGIIPVAFCETCLVSIRDLAEQMCLRCAEIEEAPASEVDTEAS